MLVFDDKLDIAETTQMLPSNLRMKKFSFKSQYLPKRDQHEKAVNY
jgi:hypothetical protein